MQTSTDVRVSVDEVRERLQRGEPIVFLDVRNPQAWANSDVKLPGAIRIPLDELAARADELPRDRPIVAYCT
jgi:rhodanese-related sulfurtransferase